MGVCIGGEGWRGGEEGGEEGGQEGGGRRRRERMREVRREVRWRREGAGWEEWGWSLMVCDAPAQRS